MSKNSSLDFPLAIGIGDFEFERKKHTVIFQNPQGMTLSLNTIVRDFFPYWRNNLPFARKKNIDYGLHSQFDGLKSMHPSFEEISSYVYVVTPQIIKQHVHLKKERKKKTTHLFK